jgi:DNA gyrase inhibitor GyrI
MSEKLKNAEWSGGKGSVRRKTSNQDLYSQGWDLIFGKTKKEKNSSEETVAKIQQEIPKK